MTNKKKKTTGSEEVKEATAAVDTASTETTSAAATDAAADVNADGSQKDAIDFAGPVLRDGESRLGLIVVYENEPNSDGTIDPFTEAAAAQAFVLLPPQYDIRQADDAASMMMDEDTDNRIREIHVVRCRLA